MPYACILVVAGLLTRSPTAVGGERVLRAGMVPPGIYTITRHPFLWGSGLWALAHLLANGDLAALIFFGGMATLSFAGMLAIDHKRVQALGADWEALRRHSSRLPFHAALTGRVRLDIGVASAGGGRYWVSCSTWGCCRCTPSCSASP